MTKEPMRRMDIRDLCICGHAYMSHERLSGACGDTFCRCRSFYADSPRGWWHRWRILRSTPEERRIRSLSDGWRGPLDVRRKR